jgi:hypothetical protein
MLSKAMIAGIQSDYRTSIRVVPEVGGAEAIIVFEE